MRLYITGPVSGFDDLNYPAFGAARRQLAGAGYTALVPHDFIAADATWQQAMRRSLETLAKADGLACLPGWEKSNGATLEVEVAHRLGIPAMKVESWLDAEKAERVMMATRRSKLCGRCKRIIPLAMFNESASSGDGRQSYCRDCMREYRESKRTDERGNGHGEEA